MNRATIMETIITIGIVSLIGFMINLSTNKIEEQKKTADHNIVGQR